MRMNFRKLLLESLDEGFYSLGEDCKHKIYFLLEKNFMLTKQNIPDQIEDFSDAIDCILGFGSKILKIIIMKNLFRKISSPIPYLGNQETLDFTNYLQFAQVACTGTFTETISNRNETITLTQNL